MTHEIDAVLNALRIALEQDPSNGPAWVHYADLLRDSGAIEQAADALRKALALEVDTAAVTRKLVPLLRQLGELDEAMIRAEQLLEAADAPETRLELARILAARGDAVGAVEQYTRVIKASPDWEDAELERLRADLQSQGVPFDDGGGEDRSGERQADEQDDAADGPPEYLVASVVPEGLEADQFASQFEWEQGGISFDDVAGLDAVKQQIHLRIIAPFKNQAIYEAFGRQGGGGILLYGPPGCGKTFIARATAGECGARFVAVGIHDLLDKYWGESEKLMHALFDDARRRAPTVLFFDEFDALGASRGRSESQFWKTLVDQLLQEMDGLSGRNENVLVFAATNVPWNVDSAFRRPGRFDRVLFVPPPDGKAREQILAAHCRKLPGGDRIDVKLLAQRTALMTGADLKALCERASEAALTKSLTTGNVHPVTMEDFAQSLSGMQSSAGEWLSTARNYAKYSNDGGQFDELVDFLRGIKRW